MPTPAPAKGGPARSAAFAVLLVGLLPELIPTLTAGILVMLMVLLVLHQLVTWLIVVLSVITVVVVAVAVTRLRLATLAVERASRIAWVWDLLALAVAAVSALVNGKYSDQRILVDRDPAFYANTAAYLGHHRGLPVHIVVADLGPHVVVNTYGFDNTHTFGDLYPQGMHGAPVILGTIDRFAGASAMLHGNALVGGISLLAIYSLARLIVHRAWAVVAIAALAGSLPEIYFTREVYSEPIGMVCVFSGLAVLWRAQSHHRPGGYLLAGLIVGASMTTRIDAFLQLIAVVALCMVVLAKAGVGERRAAGWCCGAFLLGAAIPGITGAYDLAVLSRQYYVNLPSEVHEIAAAVVVTILLGGAWVAICWWRPGWQQAVWKRTPQLAVAGGGLLALIFLLLALRPLRGDKYGKALLALVAQVQAKNHQTVNGHRLYTEHSLYWVGYYFGPVTVVLGVLGTALLVGLVIGRRNWLAVPFLAAWLPPTLGYLITPSIAPDQPWASRRLLAMAIPGLLIGVGVLAERVAASRVRVLAAIPRPPLVAVGAVVGIATIVVPVVISKPLIKVREFVPDLAAVQAVCTTMGPNSELLFLDQFGLEIDPTVFSFCNHPVGILRNPSRAEVAAAYAVATAHHLKLFVGGSSASSMVLVGINPPLPTITFQDHEWQSTLTRSPDHAVIGAHNVFLAQAGPDGALTLVPPVLNAPAG